MYHTFYLSIMHRTLPAPCLYLLIVKFALRHLVCYEDFCTALERHAAAEGGQPLYSLSSARHDQDARGRTRLRDSGRLDDLRASARLYDTYEDSPFSSQNIEKWYHQDATPREQRDFERVYGSLDKFKAKMDPEDDPLPRRSNSFHPPRPSDSVSRLRLDKTTTGMFAHSHSWDRDRDRGGIATSFGNSSQESPRYGNTSPGRHRHSGENRSSAGNLGGTFHAPRSPPSKVGSVMWGSDTPLRSKGHEIQMDASCWVCSVCYFTENPIKAKSCEICQSPNYNVQKDFQIKQQCGNCTFLNGHFAKECEMCGEKIGRH
jgi:hypothetical protein